MAERMTPVQRHRHYDDWLASGMTRAAYAHLHGINHKTFWHLCRTLSADVSRGSAPADNRLPLLLVTLIQNDSDPTRE